MSLKDFWSELGAVSGEDNTLDFCKIARQWTVLIFVTSIARDTGLTLVWITHKS